MPIQSEFRERGTSEDQVRRELQAAFDHDCHFSESPVLYSMCNMPTALAREAHMQFLEANLGDPNLYPGTKQLEEAVVSMLIDLLDGNGSMDGKLVAGGTEANITALWAYRNSRKASRVILPRTAHYSFSTAADMLGLDLEWVDVDEDYRMQVPEVAKLLDTEEIAAVVAVAGTTEHGQIDPIPEIQQLCLRHDVPLHVDAAFGGLVFPFLTEIGRTPPCRFDFVLEGVTSITVDPHKMGHATAPCGALLVRDPELFKSIEQETFYLSSETLSSILGTRCSAGVASAYAVMRHLGRTGYCRMLERCMSTTDWFAERLRGYHLQLAIDPISPVVCVKMPDEESAKAVQKRLLEDERKWWVSRTVHPPGIRFVVMPHVSKNELKGFLPEFKNICDVVLN